MHHHYYLVVVNICLHPEFHNSEFSNKNIYAFYIALVQHYFRIDFAK